MGRQRQIYEERVQFLAELLASDHNRLIEMAQQTGLTKVDVIRTMLRNCKLVKRTQEVTIFDVVPRAVPVDVTEQS